MELMMTGFVTTIMLVVSSFAMFFVEHQAQPDKFNNIFSALWWEVKIWDDLSVDNRIAGYRSDCASTQKAHVEKLQQLEEMKRLELVSETEYKELREELIKRFVD